MHYKSTLLIADPDDDFLETLSALLQGDFRCLLAHDEHSLSARLDEADLVLISYPFWTYSVERLLELELAKPIVFMTGYLGVKGLKDPLLKPFSEQEVRARISEKLLPKNPLN